MLEDFRNRLCEPRAVDPTSPRNGVDTPIRTSDGRFLNKPCPLKTCGMSSQLGSRIKMGFDQRVRAHLRVWGGRSLPEYEVQRIYPTSAHSEPSPVNRRFGIRRRIFRQVRNNGTHSGGHFRGCKNLVKAAAGTTVISDLTFPAISQAKLRDIGQIEGTRGKGRKPLYLLGANVHQGM